ncbi:MAG: hypothetical protein NTU87_06725 [Verrucomicrobia bacterium]|nr:hypothetical protein [Verrucomicrobiota bacterium]
MTNKNSPLILNVSWFKLSLVKEIMNMKKLNVALAILVAAVMAGNAQTVTSEVVGYQTIAAAKGYTPLGFPLVNSPVVSGTVSSKTASSIVLSSVIPSAVNAAKPYYLEVTSGPLAGERVDVSVTPGSATVGIVASSGNTDTLSTLGNGASVVVRQHVTLGQVDQSCSPALVTGDVNGDRILFFIGGSFVAYFKDTDGLWYENGGYDDMTDMPVRPGVGLLLQRKGNTATTVTQIGTVRSNKFARPYSAGYQVYAPAYPVDLTPISMGATTANGWRAGSNANLSDRILTFSGGSFVSNFLDSSDNSWYENGGYDPLDSVVLLPSAKSIVVFKQVASDGVVETSPVAVQ